MPPDFKQMAELFGPMVMGQIPGAFDAGQFYSDMFQMSTNAQIFGNLNPQQQALAVNTVAMLGQNQIFNPMGFVNTAGLGGMSASTAQQAVPLFLQELFQQNRNLARTEVKDLTDGAATPDQAINNFERNVAELEKQGQITSTQRKAYNRVVSTYKTLVDQTRRDNANYDQLTEEQKRAALNKTLQETVENHNTFKDFRDRGPVDASDISQLRSIINGDGLEFVSLAEIEQIQAKCREAIPLIGRNISALANILQTEDIKELQKVANELNWGSLTSTKDVQKIRYSMDQAQAMATASNRDMLSILTERAELTSFAASTVGGRKFVSRDHVINLQRIRNQELDNENYGGFRTADEADAAYERGYVDTRKHFLDAMALEGLLKNNPELFTDQQRATAEEYYKIAKQALQEGDVATALLYNNRARGLLSDMGIFSEQRKQKLATESSEDWMTGASLAGAVSFYSKSLAERSGDGTFTEAEQQSMVDAFNETLSFLGTGAKGVDALRKALKAGSEEEQVNSLIQSLGLGEKDKPHIRELLNKFRGLDERSREDIFQYILQNESDSVVVGSVQKRLESRAALQEAKHQGDFINDSSGGFFDTLWRSFMSDDSGLTVEKFMEAKIHEYKLNGHVGASDAQAIAALKAAGKLKDTQYLGQIDLDTGKIDDAGIKSLSGYLGISEEEFKEKYIDQKTGEVNISDVKGDLAKLKDPPNIILTQNGSILTPGKDDMKAIADESKRLQEISKIDWATIWDDKKITKEELIEHAGFEFDENGKVKSLFSETSLKESLLKRCRSI